MPHVDDADFTKGTVTIGFAETAKLRITGPYDLTQYFQPPLIGAAAALAIPSQFPFTGAGISWTPAHASFQEGQAYTATVTMTPNPGYTLTGVAGNSFTHTGASSVAYASGSNVVTISFAALPLVIESFGSADTTPNSARKLMAARKDDASITDTNPLVIDLPAGTETITAGSHLYSTDAPKWVVVNGNGRTLRFAEGVYGVTMLRVEGGITLTLRDMILQSNYSYNVPAVYDGLPARIRALRRQVCRSIASEGSVTGAGKLWRSKEAACAAISKRECSPATLGRAAE
jgi:hypothetical protein